MMLRSPNFTPLTQTMINVVTEAFANTRGPYTTLLMAEQDHVREVVTDLFP